VSRRRSQVKKYTSLGDWNAVLKNGGDPGRRPIHEDFGRGPINGMPQPPVPTHFPVSFPLHLERASARERKHLVDQLLANMGVRPKR